MNLDHNKETALAFIASLSRGEPDASLLCEDVTWWVPGLGTFDQKGFFALADNFATLVKGPAVMTIVAVTAEDDRVAIEAAGEAELLDGRAYSNTYHFLFYLRDGKIRHVREHNNTAVPMALFGDAISSGVDA